MSPLRFLSLLIAACSSAAPAVAAGPPQGRLAVWPAVVTLDGKASRQQLIVSERGGTSPDRTRNARYVSESPRVVAVSAAGVVTPVADGEGIVSATVGTQMVKSVVRVKNAGEYRPATFERDIEPVLGRAGCNAGACHGKARGQNGFALSLLGFDREFDFHAIVSEGRGRRIFPASPDNSLFLRKASAEVPHGGGKKLPVGSPGYELVRRWVVAGCPRTPAATPALSRISVEPGGRVLDFRAEQQLAVTAHYDDGTTEDVTHLATYQSNDSVFVRVDEHGKLTAGPLPGEATIMARYMEKFGTCHVLVPLPGVVPAELYEKLPRNNFIDGLVWDKLRLLGITPSDPAPDATFHRRAFLSIIGKLPTPEETRAFLADARADKRAKLIDALLDRPEYADFWANKWADLLRPNPYRVGIKAVYNLDAWLRDAFRRNKPYDQFVREILTARGSTFRNGATVVFRDRREPDEIAPLVGQLFLGIRLDCAKCHHHPFERWSQDDFYSFAAYFGRIGRKGVGLSPPISGGEEMLFVARQGQVRHPNGKVMKPRPLFGKADDVTEDRDPRAALADWATSPDNPYFARVIVNRVWADLMGRGIVEPVDDLRDTNPPANGPLLDALADDFRKNGHDLKKLIRAICTSHAFALSSVPKGRNAHDSRNHSRHYRERLRAEVLLDAVSDITGVAESFPALPPGSRAMEVWTARSDSLFLDSFGRPDPNQDPPCERTTETSVVQALHLMNGDGVSRKITSPLREGGEARRREADPDADRGRLASARLLPTADRRGAEAARRPVRPPEGGASRGGRRYPVGDAQHARVRFQRLRGTGMAFHRNCAGMTRRDCLQLGLGTLLGGGLASALRARGAEDKTKAGSSGKAKSCILIWMDGGPTHYETFDPKPAAPVEFRGEFGSIATRITGARFSEHMTRMAGIADRLAVVRSIRHDQGNHGAGNHYLMTGAPPRIPVGCGAFVSFHPSMGSVTAAEKGAPAGLPAYFSLPSMTRSGGPNFLGSKFAPFVVAENPNSPDFRVRDVALPRGLTGERFVDRTAIRSEVDRFQRLLDRSALDPAPSLDEHYKQAHQLMASKEAQAAFDIGREPPRVRETYGRNSFGQRALLARRLVEAGVPFITLHDGGWDHHTKLFATLKTRLPQWDQTFAALVEDLRQRGLLESTLVIALGEFGRTPQINKDAGRDHWSNAMSVVFAGGGTPGGQVVGATDAKGFSAVERVLSPEGFVSTVYSKLGIDPNKILYTQTGRPTHLVSDPTPIRELIG